MELLSKCIPVEVGFVRVYQPAINPQVQPYI